MARVKPIPAIAALAALVTLSALASGRGEGWLGVVLPGRSLDLAPEIPGQVREVYVREGEAVRRGQTVAVLDAAHDRQELVMAETGLRAAETQVARARLELAEAENRLAGRRDMPDAFPREEIRRTEIQKELAQTDLEGARARVEEQRARVVQARDRLAKAGIRAPADGVITRRYAEPGALAGPGQPVAHFIADGRKIVRFAAPPEQARSLRTAGRVTVASADGRRATAVLEPVSREVDPPTGMVILVAVLEPAAGIEPGSVVRVHPA